jgi:hypothetical protein
MGPRGAAGGAALFFFSVSVTVIAGLVWSYDRSLGEQEATVTSPAGSLQTLVIEPE